MGESPLTIHQIVHPDDQAVWAEHLRGLGTNEELYLELDFRIFKQSSEVVWINHICKSIFGSEGVYLGRLVSNRDITIRKTMDAKLQELLKIDYPTGLNNRRHFMELGGLLFKTAKRYGFNLAVSMIDIDHFKAVNETCGHEAGDIVLQKLSKTALSTFRSSDIIGRLGGEEFAVVMPETDFVEATSAVERFRNAVASDVVTYEGTPLSITVSCGIALFAAGDSKLEELLKKADDALYQAKRDGRNRVVALT